MGFIRNLLGRAKDLVARINSRDDSLSDEDYADMVAQTEVHGVVEQAKLDVYDEFGLMMDWDAEPGACQMCLENAEAGPLVAGNAWPSGHTSPGAHPRCRCRLVPAN